MKMAQIDDEVIVSIVSTKKRIETFVTFAESPYICGRKVFETKSITIMT